MWKDPASIAEELVRTFLVPFIHCWAAEGKRRPVSECERELDDKLRDLWDSTDHLTIDGSSFGNVTRFINDGGEHGSNLQIVQVCTPSRLPARFQWWRGARTRVELSGRAQARASTRGFLHWQQADREGRGAFANTAKLLGGRGRRGARAGAEQPSGDALFVEVHIDDLGEKGAVRQTASLPHPRRAPALIGAAHRA